MKHRKGLKVNIFPHPRSSGAEGVSPRLSAGVSSRKEGNEGLGLRAWQYQMDTTRDTF